MGPFSRSILHAKGLMFPKESLALDQIWLQSLTSTWCFCTERTAKPLFGLDFLAMFRLEEWIDRIMGNQEWPQSNLRWYCIHRYIHNYVRQKKGHRTITHSLAFFIGLAVFNALGFGCLNLFQHGFWNTYNRQFNTIMHIHAESMIYENSLQVEYQITQNG